MVNPAEMGGRRAGEKASSFAVTCGLLSQYLKGRGTLGDLGVSFSAAAEHSLEGRGKPELLRTMNLLPGVETIGGDDGEAAAQGGAPSDPRKGPARSMDLFPQRAGFGASGEKKPDLIREPQRAQMTIFYAGKVVVFKDFPVDKASDLMAMAGQGRAAHRLPVEQAAPVTPQLPSPRAPGLHNSANTALTSNSEAKSAATVAAILAPAVAAEEALRNPPQPAALDLPIARRVSLHRFLEKRKDRISAKAPYPVSSSPAGASGPSSASPAITVDNRQWLGLVPQAFKPEDLHV